jgi:hypothetical protein
MSLVTIQGNASGTGTLTIAAPNTNTDYTLTLPQATTTIVGTDATQTLTNKTINGGALQSATSQASTSGTSIDFTGIPSWVKRITVMFNGVSTSGTSAPRIRIGNSGGLVTSGYLGSCLGNANTAVSNVSFTAGFDINDGSTAATTRVGAFVLTLIDSSNNWVISGTQGQGNTNAASFIGGSVNAGGVLDRIRITTVNGTDTFDAGSINILYE